MNSTSIKTITTNEISLQDLCDEERIPYFYTTIRLNAKGDKVPMLPKEFPSFSYEKAMEWNDSKKDILSYNKMCVILRASKYMVIDFDDNLNMKERFEKYGGENYYTKSTGRGLPHLWRLKDDDDWSKNITKVGGEEVDFIYSYSFERRDAKMRFNDKTGLDMPSFDYLALHPKPISKTALKAKQDAPPPVRSERPGSNDHYRRLILHLNNHSRVKAIASYSEWLKVGFACKSAFLPDIWFEIFKSYSAMSSNPEHNSNYVDYEAWEKMFEGEAKCGIPTILEYSKANNETVYNEIEADYRKKENKKLLEEGKALLLEAVATESAEAEALAETKANEANVVDTDADACDKFYKKYGKKVVRSIDGWCVNMPNTNHWEVGDEFVKQLIIQANFKKRMLAGILPYSANYTGCSNIFKTLCCRYDLYPLNKNFIDEINDATKGRVYFKDQYWDLVAREWKPIDEVIPLVFIDRPAPVSVFTKITDANVKDFETKVLNMFRSDGDKKMYLHALSRALGGYIIDKMWFVKKGMRNSGKGVLQEQAKMSFGEYIAFIDPPMSKSYNSGDASENRWILTAQCHLKRIAFTNEIKGLAGKVKLTFDGNSIKKIIASGGDLIPTRNHFKGEIFVKNNTTTFMSLNEVPVCDPVDALDNMVLFDMPYKFVEKGMVAEDIMYREASATLKSEIASNTLWRDIYLYLIFKHFKNEPVKISDMSAENMAEREEIASTSVVTNPIQLLNKYTVAAEKGWISTDDLRRILKPANMSDQKMGKFLKMRGYVPKKGKAEKYKDINGEEKERRLQGYEGLSIKPKEGIEEDETDS
jgi:hypothetical protein